MLIAILGCGSIGARHLRNLSSLGYTEWVAFDPSPQARQKVEQELGVVCLATLDEVWARHPGVALIAAPSNLHVALAMAAAERDCHLFIEKPLAHSLDHVAALDAQVEQRHLVTMVGCNMRFHPGPAMVKQLIDQGAVGQVLAARLQSGSYLPRWRPGQDYRQSYSASPEWGGAILDCIHEIDLALWYFGPAKLIGAACRPAHSLGLETDGLAEIILQHASGVLSNVHLNFVQRDYRRTCQVIGSEGTIYWDFSDRQVKVYGPEGELAQSFPEPQEWNVNQMYLDELAHFLQAVQAGRQTINPISGGAAALEIALQARQAQLERVL